MQHVLLSWNKTGAHLDDFIIELFGMWPPVKLTMNRYEEEYHNLKFIKYFFCYFNPRF